MIPPLFKKYILFSAFTLIATSALGSDLPNFDGRFYGSIETNARSGLGVAQIPKWIKEGEAKVLKFRVYRATATSRGLGIKIQSKGNSTDLTINSFGTVQLLSPQTGACSSGSNSEMQAQLCWSKDSLNLEARVLDKNIKINLAKTDKMPTVAEGLDARKYELDELMGRAKFLNYSVQSEFESVYQAKKRVKVAIGGLLPRVSVSNVFSFFRGNPLDSIEIVGNLVPFIFPSNWFAWKEAKSLYKAERISYAAMRGNEMNTVQGLYYNILRTKELQTKLSEQVSWLISVRQFLIASAQNNAQEKIYADTADAVIANLKSDIIKLQQQYNSSLGALGMAVALPPATAISDLEPVKIPDLNLISQIDKVKLAKDAKEKSLEIETMSYLVAAAKSAKKEVIFRIFDPSRDAKIGFGYPSEIKISQSQIRQVEVQKNQIGSMIEQKSVEVAESFNAALAYFKEASVAYEKSKSIQANYVQKLQLNEGTLTDLIPLNNETLSAAVKLVESKFDFLVAASTKDRLVREGFYQDLEGAIPMDQETLKIFQP